MSSQSENIIEEIVIDDFEKLFQSAEDAYYQGKYQEAVKLFTEVLKINPTHAYSHFKKGNCFVYINNNKPNEESNESFENAITHGKTESEKRCYLGILIACQFRKFDQSLEYFDQSIELDPTFSLAYIEKSSSLWELNRYEESIRFALKATEFEDEKSNAELYNNIACCYLDTDDFYKAIEYLNKSIELNPQFFIAYCNLAHYHNVRGEFQQGLDVLAKAELINPNPIDFCYYFQMGFSQQNLKQVKNSIKNFEKSLSYEENQPNAYYRMGLSYYSLKNYHKTIECMNKVLQLSPNYLLLDEIYNLISLCNLMSEKYRTALEFIEKSVKLNEAVETYKENKEYIFKCYLKCWTEEWKTDVPRLFSRKRKFSKFNKETIST